MTSEQKTNTGIMIVLFLAGCFIAGSLLLVINGLSKDLKQKRQQDTIEQEAPIPPPPPEKDREEVFKDVICKIFEKFTRPMLVY